MAQQRTGGVFALALLSLLAGCAAPVVAPDAHAPEFAKRAYAPFSRTDAIAIAQREWRLFGSIVNDAPPGTLPDLGEAKPERAPGLWQRVGEYWFEGQNAGEPDHAWTGKHDEFGREFAPAVDGNYAWSAAFISYVMRIAGAGPRFPYSPSHFVYIDIAARMARGEPGGWAIRAADPAEIAPIPGDLICTGRGAAKFLRYADLPAGRFTGHCDIVVQDTPDGWAVIGGNVDDAVTLKHVPHDGNGRIAGPDGASYDSRTPWMVVIQVGYAQ
jgi:hypothetical protein